MSVLMQDLSQDIAAIVEEVRRSLVVIGNGRGHGAGTIWHPAGLIVTNAHVARHGPLKVTLPDGRILPAQILARDERRDLAALRVEANELPSITLGDSRSLQPGQWVVAIGHPWGVQGAATAGSVLGAGSEWPELPAAGMDWVVARLHLRPGHSGGPLVDANARLVGICTMINGPDLGFAVPVHAAKRFLVQALGSA